MKISLKWLENYVEIKEFFRKPEELGELLTRAGLEVEEVVNRTRDFDHVVVGLILEKDKHPSADKLSVCKVTTGEGVIHQIVCGAKNHQVNDRVAVALPGAILPGNFSIQRNVIRGVESAGMLCSNQELGLSAENDGILILSVDAPVGKSFAEYMGLDDVTMEIKVTPNRADCLSHFGVAREIGCLLGRPLKEIQPKMETHPESTQKQIRLEVKATDLCPRYAGRFIQGVKIGPSPTWLKQRLESVGAKSINNVVDATNFVMLEMGQPLHAFDAGQLAGSKIIVDRAPKGENFKTLDGTTLTLKGDELTIRDAEKSVCVAGVIGGLSSGVSEKTQDVFLESAYFTPASVRRTSRSHGINTDSGYRFSRGVDPQACIKALDRATEIVLSVAGGKAYAEPYDFYPKAIDVKPTEVSLGYISERLGYAVEKNKFVDMMSRLSCHLEEKSSDFFKITPPSFRVDLEQDVDYVEEYARLQGYEYIPEALPVTTKAPSMHDKNFLIQRKICEIFQSQGFQQAFNFAFVASAQQKKFIGSARGLSVLGFPSPENCVKLMNPLSDEMDVMRSILAFSLFKNLSANYHYGNQMGRLFECGPVFITKDRNYSQQLHLSAVAWGSPEGLWRKDEKFPLIFDLKSAVEFLLKNLKISNFSWLVPSDRGEYPSFVHRGQFSQLQVEGKIVGFLGSFHPLLLEENKLRVPAAVFEMNLDNLLTSLPRTFRTERISKYPVMERDLAFLMPQQVLIGNVIKTIKENAGPLLQQVEVFDIYEGENLNPGKISVAFRLRFQDTAATLQESQINEVQGKLVEVLGSELGLTLR